MRIVTRATGIRVADNVVTVTTDTVPIRFWFLSDTVLRMRAGFDGTFEEASYSLATTAWEDRLDDVMKDYRTRIDLQPVHISETETTCHMSTKGFHVEVQKDPYVVSIFNASGELLHRDLADLALLEDSNHRRSHTAEIFPGDHFYGFGESTGPLDKLESSVELSPKDAMGYNPAKTGCLYKHIPFYIRLNETSRHAVGYFYHNTAECDFDLGREKSNYWVAHSRYRVLSGDIDLFFLAGPTVRDILADYTMLTGRSCLLPKQALGYLGSSMYYAELPQACDRAIQSFADKATAEGIPMDGFQLSSGYTTQHIGTIDAPATETTDATNGQPVFGSDGQERETGERRYVFTWNVNRFPDPASFFKSMADRGITVSPNVKPGILLTHPKLDEFQEKLDLVGDTGTWWGGKGVFADFTSPRTRANWKELLKENVLRYGTTSVWNDNCEYDSVVNKDASVSFDGAGGTIGDLKSVMSNLMCQLTVEAIQEEQPETRPFVVCRSGHAGIQKYAQTWAGDNYTSWETLRHNIATMLNMAVSGVANYGCDIGGFAGPAPTPELLVRWVQNGIFQPRFSIHSVNADGSVTEPWMYPEVTPLVKDAIQLRYRLLPYLYSLMARCHETGAPILEPLFSAFQNDPACYGEDVNFMLGDLLVATVVEPGATTKEVYLPSGSDFYNFYTHEKYVGGQKIALEVGLDSIPLFLKSGAVVPMTDQILVVADRDTQFTIYDDDGVSNAYRRGEYKKITITVKDGQVTKTEEGSYASPLSDLPLTILK